jgi:hypothetical protein
MGGLWMDGWAGEQMNSTHYGWRGGGVDEQMDGWVESLYIINFLFF